MENTAKSRKYRYKKVRCTVCVRCMLSDKLKRHSLTHRDILAMTEDEVREELKKRNAIHLQREEKRQNIVEIARQENIPSDRCWDDAMQPSTSLSSSTGENIEALEQEMLQDNQIYMNKIELGKQIVAIIDKGVVRQESLR